MRCCEWVRDIGTAMPKQAEHKAMKPQAKANASTNQKSTVSADMQRLFGVAPSNAATVGTSAEEAVVATSASGNRSHGWPQRQPQLQPITFR